MNNDTDKPGDEQRRDRRFQVSQSAIITQPGHTEIACEIRDFCLGGLFLRFTNPEAAIASLAKRADAEVEIVFSPASSTTTRTFRVPAQLKRLSPLGVGVAFVRQPVEALRALQKLRMAGHRQKLAALPASAAHAQLREAATTLLAETLQQAQDQMMRLINDRLSAAAVQATGIAEHSGLLSAGHEFNRQAASIQTRFVRQVMEALKPGFTASRSGNASGELALVDELDFEDWLATSSEANKLEEQFREQLSDMEPRIGQLFGLACDHSTNPFGPAVIGHAYRAAIEDLPILARARQVAYTTLREILVDQLAPLYAELLALLPVADPVPSSPPAGAVCTSSADSPAGTEPPVADDASPAIGSAASAQPASPQSALGRMAGSLLDFFRGQPSSQPRPVAPASGPAPATAGYHAPPTGGMAAPATGAGSPQPGGLSAAPPVTGFGVAHSPVLQRLASAGALPPAVSVEMQRSVDMFGALFDTMHAEKSVSEGMKPFFHQLEASLIKLALSDPQFLASPAHPAHKVLNTLDRISMVAGDDGKIADPRLMRLMTRWTDRIHAEAEKNPAVFEEARTQLERVVKPLLNERSARVFRLQEMCEGRQSAEVSKQGILRRLLARLDERTVPNAVIELLNGGWRNVLLMAEMRHGTESPEAREAWDVLQRLTAWLDPGRDQVPTTSEIQTLLQHVDQALTQVCADKFAQDRIVDQLAAALFDQDAAARQQTAVTARLNDATAEPLTEAQDNLVERLRVGDWLQFKSLDVPLNLIWMGDQPHVYVFANYRGIKKLDLKRADLLESLETDDAQWTEDLELPLMDRSYSAMIQKMQRDLVWQASHDPATGLANRKSFFRAVRRAWLRNPSSQGSVIGVAHLDIGTASGEAPGVEVRTAILRDYAQRLPGHFPADARFARAGESGLAFWCEARDSAAAQACADTFVGLINAHPLEISGVRYRVRPAIGLMWTGDCLNPETYYDNANAACATARETGESIVQYRSEAGDSGVLELAQWAQDLTRILADNQLALNIQPVVAPADAARTPLFHEVLLHPDVQDGRNIQTRELIDVAERLQRITEIDRWVVRHVLQWMRDHADHLASIGGFAINLSGQSVVNPLFLKFVQAELARGDLPGHKLIFALSEADAVEGHAQTQLFMRQLQRLGCRFILDDFGVGTSSYTRLKSMKLDYLKKTRPLPRPRNRHQHDRRSPRALHPRNRPVPRSENHRRLHRNPRRPGKIARSGGGLRTRLPDRRAATAGNPG